MPSKCHRERALAHLATFATSAMHFKKIMLNLEPSQMPLFSLVPFPHIVFLSFLSKYQVDSRCGQVTWRHVTRKTIHLCLYTATMVAVNFSHRHNYMMGCRDNRPGWKTGIT